MAVTLGLRGPKRKYSVDGGSYSNHVYADTLVEAKRAGMTAAKKEAWRGKWNLLYIVLVIYKADAPDSHSYSDTGWRVYVPVRGSGATADRIVAEIKKRYGVKPLQWVRR